MVQAIQHVQGYRKVTSRSIWEFMLTVLSHTCVEIQGPSLHPKILFWGFGWVALTDLGLVKLGVMGIWGCWDLGNLGMRGFGNLESQDCLTPMEIDMKLIRARVFTPSRQ